MFAHRKKRWFAAISICSILICSLGGCTTPTKSISARAASLKFEPLVIAGTTYKHRLYAARTTSPKQVLHIYIEHDGSPWLLEGTQVSRDPTPRNPLMLEWMSLDTASRLYLGRPCYFDLDTSPPCSPLLWTHQRYSEGVVDSMVAALQKFLGVRPHDQLAFFGYSGGGALAMLLAERFPETVAVVTIAGNLDIDAWVKLHDYSQLEGSINPTSRPPLPERIVQRHYVGAKDDNIPPGIVREFSATRPGSQVVEIPNFDHICCWGKLWPKILANLDSLLVNR